MTRVELARACATVLALALGVGTTACGEGDHPAVVVQAAPPVQPVGPVPVPPAVTALGDTASYAEMHHVHFRFDPVLALDIAELRGRMVATRAGEPIVFDDPTSFTLRIGRASAEADTVALARLMNAYVFGFRGAPISGVRIGVHDSLVRVHATLHKVVSIPVTITASVSATADGRVRLHPVDVNAVGIDADWLLHLLGVQLDELISTKKAQGLAIDGNDLLIDPTAALPPPPVTGRLVGARVIPRGIAMRFDDSSLVASLPTGLRPAHPSARNFMFFRGGVLRFGKLFMVRADVQLVDSTPGDPFDFFLREYHKQLVAGHAEIQRDYGLFVLMPDYRLLAPAVSRTTAAARASAGRPRR